MRGRGLLATGLAAGASLGVVGTLGVESISKCSYVLTSPDEFKGDKNVPKGQRFGKEVVKLTINRPDGAKTVKFGWSSDGSSWESSQVEDVSDGTNDIKAPFKVGRGAVFFRATLKADCGQSVTATFDKNDSSFEEIKREPGAIDPDFSR